MNILNNGRFGIPAACTGSMKYCIKKSVKFFLILVIIDLIFILNLFFIKIITIFNVKFLD